MYHIETVDKRLWLSIDRLFKGKVEGWEYIRIKEQGKEVELYFNYEDPFLFHKIKHAIMNLSIGWDLGRKYEQNKRVRV